jgi:hypothetical protein
LSRHHGPEIASVLSLEAFYRNFNNRREAAAYFNIPGVLGNQWASQVDIIQGTGPALCASGEFALIVGTFVGTHERRETDLMKYQ